MRYVPILLLEYSPLIFSFLTHNAAFCDVIKDLKFLNEFLKMLKPAKFFFCFCFFFTCIKVLIINTG